MCHVTVQAERGGRDATLYAPPTPYRALPNGDWIDRHPNATPQKQRTEDKEEFVGLVFGQLVQVEDLHDVGPSVPEKFGMQRPGGIASKGLPDIWRGGPEPPFYRRVIRTDGHNLPLVEEGQTISPHPWLRFMPLGMRGINLPVRAWRIPHLPPTRPHQ